MGRPIIKIKLDISDWVIEIAGAIFIILMIGFPVYYFSELPEVIPRHFSATGEADGFAGKNTIWIVSAIGLAMYTGMLILSKYPHVFSYPKKITEENAKHQYHLAAKLIRTLNMLIAAGLFYISYSTIQTVMNFQSGLGMYFLPILLLFVFGTIGFYLYMALKRKSPTSS